MIEARQPQSTQLMRVIAPLAVHPLLKLGKAVFVAQLDFLCERFGQILPDSDAQWFVTMQADLIQRFPFWCKRTIKKYVSELTRAKILLRKKADSGTAYRIDLNYLMKITGVDLRERAKNGHSVCYFSPVVAETIGISAAVLLQQTLYWSKTMYKMDPQHYGREVAPHHSYSFYKSLLDWGFDFPFWHSHTIFNLIHALQSVGILKIEHDPKRANWYSVDFKRASDLLSTPEHCVSFENNELSVTRKLPNGDEPPETNYEPDLFPSRLDRHFSELREQLEMMTGSSRARLFFRPIIDVLDALKNFKRLHIADIEKVRSLLRFYSSTELLEAIAAVSSSGRTTWKRLKRYISTIPVTIPTG